MGIKQQIAFLVAIAVSAVLTTGGVAAFATHRLAQTMERHKPLHPIIEDMVTLTTLSNTWFRRPTERIEEQWAQVISRLTLNEIPALHGRGEFAAAERDALIAEFEAINRDFNEAVQREGGSSSNAAPDRYLGMIGERISQRLEQAIDEVFSASDQTFTWVRQDARENFILVTSVVAVAVLLSLALGVLMALRISRKLTESIAAVSSAAAQMAAAAEQQERIALQQAASVNETTTTMEELASSARRSNTQAKGSLETLEGLGAQASDGRDSADEMVQQMDTLAENVMSITEQIRAVGEQADQIDSVTADVAEIAAQTNLLALNAAVEAARAGEHGKGFSVVADEIRKLADESKSSASRIRALVAETQKRSDETVHVSEEGLATLRNAVQVVSRSSEVFKAALAGFEGIGDRMQQIALTSDQQAQAINQAVEAMDAINTGASETVTALKQTTRAIDDLRQVAERAKAMI
jgi:methyl-accepting chemotaxis protein